MKLIRTNNFLRALAGADYQTSPGPSKDLGMIGPLLRGKKKKRKNTGIVQERSYQTGVDIPVTDETLKVPDTML